MVLICLYLIVVGSHKYVGSTQNLIGRLGDHYRRALIGGSCGPLTSVLKSSDNLDDLSGHVLALYDIPSMRSLSRDWTIMEDIDSRILDRLECYWIDDLKPDLNNYFRNIFSHKYLKDYHDRYLVSHGGRSINLKDAYDMMSSDYTIDSIRPELEINIK